MVVGTVTFLRIEPAAKALVVGKPTEGVAEYGRWRCPSTVTGFLQ